MPLERLRCHAAVLRALLDELERIWRSQHPSTDEEIGFGEQLIEELGRLGCLVLECASAMTLGSSDDMMSTSAVVPLVAPSGSTAIGVDVEVDPHEDGE